MRRETWLVLAITAALGISLALADKLSDFKEAVGKIGCDSIPYDDLHRDCKTEGSHVHDYCDGPRGPITCGSVSITRQIKDNLEKVKRAVEELKEKKRKLEEQRSNSSDDDEKDRLEDEIDKAEDEIDDAEDRVEKAEEDLKARKKLVEDAIYTIEKCINYRRAVMNIFAYALDRVRGETDEDIKPLARQLRDKYEAEKRGHEIAISDKENALDTCKRSQP